MNKKTLAVSTIYKTDVTIGRFFSEVDRSSQQYFGARVPLGLNWVIPETPIQLVIEGAPTILFRPAVFVYLQGSFAVRVLF